VIISNTDQTDGRTACGIGGPMVKKQSHSFDVFGAKRASGGFLVGDGPDVYALAACSRVTFSRTSNHLDFWSEPPAYVRLH